MFHTEAQRENPPPVYGRGLGVGLFLTGVGAIDTGSAYGRPDPRTGTLLSGTAGDGPRLFPSTGMTKGAASVLISTRSIRTGWAVSRHPFISGHARYERGGRATRSVRVERSRDTPLLSARVEHLGISSMMAHHAARKSRQITSRHGQITPH